METISIFGFEEPSSHGFMIGDYIYINKAAGSVPAQVVGIRPTFLAAMDGKVRLTAKYSHVTHQLNEGEAHLTRIAIRYTYLQNKKKFDLQMPFAHWFDDCGRNLYEQMEFSEYLEFTKWLSQLSLDPKSHQAAYKAQQKAGK